MYIMRTVPKSSRLNLRVAPEDEALLRRAAAATGESVSSFLVDSARVRARSVLADRTYFELDDEKWEEFTAMLERPPRYVPELRDLFDRPRPE